MMAIFLSNGTFYVICDPRAVLGPNSNGFVWNIRQGYLEYCMCDVSDTLIDIVFNVITYIEVGPVLTDLTRFHCPTYDIFNCKKHISSCCKRNIWLYEKGNYDDLRHFLSNGTFYVICDPRAVLGPNSNGFVWNIRHGYL
jgi:hypothetical protein